MMTYPDPVNPEINVADFLRLQSMEVGSDTVTWASGTNTAPSKRVSRIRLPQIGLLSRVYIDIDGGSATAYDLTIGAGAAAVAARGDGPWGIVSNLALRINGGAGFYNVSGFGSFLLLASEEHASYPGETASGDEYETAPRNVEDAVFVYAPTADHRPVFGLEIPLSLTPGNPLGMILAGNDQTTIDLEIEWGTLDKYAALSAGAVATLTLTATVFIEYFDVPNRGAFDSYVRPMLQWAHWNNEEQQNVTAQGAGVNYVTLDNHDNVLQVMHTVELNSVVNTDNVDRLKFILNRAHTVHDLNKRTFLRQQRRAIGKDLPAFLWTFYERDSLRDAVRADAYTDIRSQLDISGATIAGTSRILTATKKLIDLGAPPSGAFGG